MKIRSVVNKQLEYEHKINKLNRFNKEKNPSSFCKTNFTYYTYKLSDFPITLLELRQKIIKTFSEIWRLGLQNIMLTQFLDGALCVSPDVLQQQE